jgi:hypothetical protein
MRIALVAAGSLLAPAAFAHVGDHTHLPFSALLGHIVETAHIVFAGLAAVIAWAAYRAGQRAGVRATMPISKKDDLA